MDIVRKIFDSFYLVVKPAMFYFTRNDPECTHNFFASFLGIINSLKMDKFVFDNRVNRISSSVKISNAAGFNKNAEIPPQVLQYIGFDRVVIGTVTADSWKGNERPRVMRYPKTESMVNWMGFPGDGAEAVSRRLISYGRLDIPITVNLAPTPGKNPVQILEDLEQTFVCFEDNKNVDRLELNISCPNTKNDLGKELDSMLHLFDRLLRKDQNLYLKISPDLGEVEVEDILSVVEKHTVHGFTISNTTTKHGLSEKGGASGNAVYDSSYRVQQIFKKKMEKYSHSWKIIACGGINSPLRMRERILDGASEIQIYTPMIFSGTKLIRELRKCFIA